VAKNGKKVLQWEGGENMRRNKTFFPDSPNMVLTLNRKGIITRVNPACTKIARFKEEEMVGTKFYKLPGVFNRQTIMDYFYIFFKGFVFARPTFGYIGWLNDGEGNPHLLEFNVYPIRKKKKVKELLVIIKDLIRIDTSQKKPPPEKEFIVTIDNNNEIILPEEIREKINLSPGDLVFFEMKDDKTLALTIMKNKENVNLQFQNLCRLSPLF